MSGTLKTLPALVAALLTGCAGAPPPLDLPPAELSAQQHAAQPPGLGSPTRISATVYATAAAPTGQSVATAAAAIVRERGVPFRGSSRLPPQSSWLVGEAAAALRDELAGGDPANAQRLGDASGIVGPEATLHIAVENFPLPAVELRATASGVSVLLITPASEDAAREELHIAAPIPTGETAALFVPNPEVGAGRGGHVLVLMSAAAVASEAPAGPTGDATPPRRGARDDVPPAWRVAFAAVGEHNRRPALLALASPLRLDSVLDLVLSADEPALIAVTRALERLDLANLDGTRLPYAFERAVWRGLLPRADRDELTPALSAAFVRHLGSVAADSTELSMLLEQSADGDSFAAALRDENLAALGDHDPALRAVAFEWLTARGVVPPGYDPLADKEARRAALRGFRLAQEETGR